MEITLKSKPVSATLLITGDDYYKFYANGAPVVQGPAPSYHFAHPYYRLDVTAYLRAGSNCWLRMYITGGQPGLEQRR